MTFDDLVPGTRVFLDANCLVYEAAPHPVYGQACRTLLQRMERKELVGCTSAHVVSEMAHRLMTLEASHLFGRPLTGMANWLRRHPAEVQQLRHHRRAIDGLAAVPLAILPITGPLVSRAADLTIQFGLLSNDALIVALMQDSGLTALASRDTDFDRVPGITRYAPL